jgi:L-fucose isomerase-like protein
MKAAMDVRVNVKPVFSNLYHTGMWEGPCRVGAPEELTKEHDISTGREQFEVWKHVLETNIQASCANILEPAYIEYPESFVVPETELAKLEKDAFQTDLYLMTYRVPGLVERFHKPAAMINLGPTPVDLVAYYTDIGEEAYMAHDYEEFNELLELLQVRKAIAATKILILSGTEHIPVSVSSSIHDLPMLERRYGIRNSRVPFHLVFDEMEKLVQEGSAEVEETTRRLLSGSRKSNIAKDDLRQDVFLYRAVKNLMEQFECNAFTIPCKDLCASRLPARARCVPCIAHSLLKDERLPTACEEDLSVWLATAILMYLSHKSVFMGNPVLVKKGSYQIDELGIMKGMVSRPRYEFDEEVLEIHHSVPGLMMDGFDKPPLAYELGHFTHEGWGGNIQIDMADHDGKTVTLARFNRTADKVLVARAEILATEFRAEYCSPAIYCSVAGGVRNLRQRLAKGRYGHHLAVVYGDYVEKISSLGEIMGFTAEIHG